MRGISAACWKRAFLFSSLGTQVLTLLRDLTFHKIVVYGKLLILFTEYPVSISPGLDWKQFYSQSEIGSVESHSFPGQSELFP